MQCAALSWPSIQLDRRKTPHKTQVITSLLLKQGLSRIPGRNKQGNYLSTNHTTPNTSGPRTATRERRKQFKCNLIIIHRSSWQCIRYNILTCRMSREQACKRRYIVVDVSTKNTRQKLVLTWGLKYTVKVQAKCNSNQLNHETRDASKNAYSLRRYLISIVLT